MSKHREVGRAFAKGKPGKSGALVTTGNDVTSYAALIAFRETRDGDVILVRDRKYSVTTSAHQNAVKAELEAENYRPNGITVEKYGDRWNVWTIGGR